VSTVFYTVVNSLRLSLFSDLTLPGLVVVFRRFGTHRPHLQGLAGPRKILRDFWRWDWCIFLYRR